MRLAQEVVRIVVTHFHPDHIGAARWLGEKTGAPVCMMERSPLRPQTLSSSSAGPFAEYLIRHGMPQAAADYRSRGTLPSAFAGGDGSDPPR